MSPLQRAIVRTVCFADAIDAALTPLEIQRYLGIDLGSSASAEQVLSELVSAEELKNKLIWKNGLVVLRGREELIAERLERLAVTEEKWLLALAALRRIRHLPWIRLAAVCNTVAMGLARRESDIDLFLVSQPGRLWAVRLLTHLVLYPGSLARRGGQGENRICLSFSVTTEAIDLKKIAKQPTDPYLTFWLATLLPVIERGEGYRQLLAANGWQRRLMPNAWPRETAPALSLEPSLLSRFLEKLLAGPVGRWLELACRRIQRPRILDNPRSRLRLALSDVVVTDDMLKFHEEDRRSEIRDAFLIRAARYCDSDAINS